MIPAREALIGMYLDWVNNYLSLELWAEHNGMSLAQAEQLMYVAREVHETPHPES